MTVNVFTYGSLMFVEVWSRVVEGDYRSMPGTLSGHARFAVRDALYPGMVAMADARVDGVLYLDVQPDDLTRLDAFEGDDYRRIAVAIDCDDGVTRPSQTYLYRLQDRLLTDGWAPDAFAMDRFIATYCRDKLGS